MRMDSDSLTAMDGIEELLIKIIEYTRLEHKVISDNLNNVRTNGYIPKRLDSRLFAESLGFALAEYIKNDRLTFCDNCAIRFGLAGAFEVVPTDDPAAAEMLERNVFLYINHQRRAMLENAVNQKVAMKLLEAKRAGKLECSI